MGLENMFVDGETIKNVRKFMKTSKSKQNSNTHALESAGNAGDNTQELTWEDIQSSFIIDSKKNGAVAIPQETGKRLQELYRLQHWKERFLSVINRLHEERCPPEDSLSTVCSGRDEIEKIIIQYFFDHKDDDGFVPWRSVDGLRNKIPAIKRASSQDFFRSGVKGMKQRNAFLRVQTTDKRTCVKGNLIIVNPFCLEKGHFDQIFQAEMEQLSEKRNLVDLSFSMTIDFAKFGQEETRNFDIPERLWKHGNLTDTGKYVIEMTISRSKEKDVSISLGKDKMKFSLDPGGRKSELKYHSASLPVAMFDKDGPCFPQKLPFLKKLDTRSRSNVSAIWFPTLTGNYDERQCRLPEITVVRKDGDDDEFGEDLSKSLLQSWMQFDSDANSWICPEVADRGEYPAVGQVLAICLCVAILYDIGNASEGNVENALFTPPLPSADVHRPARQVDLRPFKLKDQLKDEELYYSTPALNSLAIALNSGDHVILTGPPGSGKTVLAKKLPALINKPHLLCTASPDWTTNELIGRYMPVAKKGGNAVLEFEPGFFLQAIDAGAWLIIDELNRSDIDSCMGPLFSVLSGHRVWLPYKTDQRTKEEKADVETNSQQGGGTASGNADTSEMHQVLAPQNAGLDTVVDKSAIAAIILKQDEAAGSGIPSANEKDKEPAPQGVEPDSSGDKDNENEFSKWRRIGICLEGDNKGLDSDTYWYKVPEDFRIICTMNDSDAGMLNQLSYALQRRFSVIRVEAPDPKNVQSFIDSKVQKIYDEYGSDPDPHDKNNRNLGRRLPAKDEDSQLKTYLKSLFASGKNDLMQLRVVGFGQLVDIINMVIEGFSCSKSYSFADFVTQENVSGLVLTLLAHGVVTKVFPQLPAFICNRDEDEVQNAFLPALQCIANCFVNANYHELQASDTTLSINEDKKMSLLFYLEKELRLLFRNQHVTWKCHWEKAKNPADQTGDQKTPPS